MRTPPVKLTREEALRQLDFFVAELDAGWERDRLDWAPALLEMLREFSREASKRDCDRRQLDVLRSRVFAYFKERRSLKGIEFVLQDIDAVCASYDA